MVCRIFSVGDILFNPIRPLIVILQCVRNELTTAAFASAAQAQAQQKSKKKTNGCLHECVESELRAVGSRANSKPRELCFGRHLEINIRNVALIQGYSKRCESTLII
jgi:hypothetical protein